MYVLPDSKVIVIFACKFLLLTSILKCVVPAGAFTVALVPPADEVKVVCAAPLALVISVVPNLKACTESLLPPVSALLNGARTGRFRLSLILGATLQCGPKHAISMAGKRKF